MDTKSILKQVEIFEGLDDDQLDAVAKCVVESRVPAGPRVIEEGCPGEAFHVITEGKVKVEKGDGEAAVTLSELGPGHHFGEMSLLDAVPTSASVTTLEDTGLLSIGRLDLEVLLSWDTVLASKMWRTFALQLSQRLREANEKLFAR